MSVNPLIATSGGHSSASLAGAGLLDSGQALSESIGGGSWVEGGLAGFATTMDVVSAVTNPLGSLFSAGIGWVIEHFDPIKGWFDDLAGNAGEVDAFARTWANVAGQLRESGELLQRRVNFDMAEMDGAAVTAYCTYATDVANHLKGSGDWAESISKGLGICSTLVQVTHDLARDCLAEVVGTALGLATELALTVGLAAPHALHVISTKVSSLAAKLGKAVTKLLHSFKALKALLKELGDLLKKAKGAFDGLPGGGGAGRSAAKDATPVPTPRPRIPEKTVDFNAYKKDPVEFDRQLKGHERGLNELTVEEFITNRDHFLIHGRDDAVGLPAQQAAREQARADKIEELFAQGVDPDEAIKKADEWMGTQAALHEPDQVAGGFADRVNGVGDTRVNSSIGKQWDYRIDDLDKHVRELYEHMTPEQRRSTYLNVRLTY